MAQMDGLKWWEKSVEYKFIAKLFSTSQLDLVWPLSGNEEQIGDAIFLHEAQYVIVEFKDEIKSFSSEYRKYRSEADAADGYSIYLDAKKAIGSSSKHLLVAGRIHSAKLELDVYKYFDCDENNPVRLDTLIDAVKENGVSREEIVAYGETLSLYKFSANDVADQGESSSGGGTHKSKPKLIGVNGDAAALYDYSPELILKLKNKPTKKNKSGLGGG